MPPARLWRHFQRRLRGLFIGRYSVTGIWIVSTAWVKFRSWSEYRSLLDQDQLCAIDRFPSVIFYEKLDIATLSRNPVETVK